MPNPEAMTDPAGAVERLDQQIEAEALAQIKRTLASLPAGASPNVRTIVDGYDRLLSRITELEKVGTARDALMAALLEVRGNVRAHLKGGKLSADMRRKVLNSCDRGLAAASQAGTLRDG